MLPPCGPGRQRVIRVVRTTTSAARAAFAELVGKPCIDTVWATCTVLSLFIFIFYFYGPLSSLPRFPSCAASTQPQTAASLLAYAWTMAHLCPCRTRQAITCNIICFIPCIWMLGVGPAGWGVFSCQTAASTTAAACWDRAPQHQGGLRRYWRVRQGHCVNVCTRPLLLTA